MAAHIAQPKATPQTFTTPAALPSPPHTASTLGLDTSASAAEASGDAGTCDVSLRQAQLSLAAATVVGGLATSAQRAVVCSDLHTATEVGGLPNDSLPDQPQKLQSVAQEQMLSQQEEATGGELLAVPGVDRAAAKQKGTALTASDISARLTQTATGVERFGSGAAARRAVDSEGKCSSGKVGVNIPGVAAAASKFGITPCNSGLTSSVYLRRTTERQVGEIGVNHQSFGTCPVSQGCMNYVQNPEIGRETGYTVFGAWQGWKCRANLRVKTHLQCVSIHISARSFHALPIYVYVYVITTCFRALKAVS